MRTLLEGKKKVEAKNRIAAMADELRKASQNTKNKSPSRNRRVVAVMDAASRSGLLGEKSTRIGGRISPALVEAAKRESGIEVDTELIEFALASIALKDEFPRAFKDLHGTVDPGLDLEF